MITINGWSLPVLDGSLKRVDVNGGSRSRRYAGRYREQRRYREFAWQGETPTLTPAEAKAVYRLLKGLGDSWTFVNTNKSFKGNIIESGAGVSYDNVYGKDAGDGMKITSGNECSIVSVLSEPFWDGTWTIIFDHSNTEGSGFSRYLRTSNHTSGNGYKNGVFSDHSIDDILQFDTTNGFQLQGYNPGVGVADAYYDNLVILPFVVTTEMAALWSLNTHEFSNVPFFDMTISNNPVVYNVITDAETSEYMKVNVDGTFYVNAQRIEFLIETSREGSTAFAVSEPPVSSSGFDSGFDSGFG